MKLRKSNSEKKEVALKTPKIEKITFNFSFITNQNGYDLLSNKEIHSKFTERVMALSSQNFVNVLMLKREQGFEQIPDREIKYINCPTEFVNSHRNFESGDKFWVFRLSNKGRVVGKMIDKTYYVIGIDTKFDSYKH